MSEERTAHNAKYNNVDWIGQKFGRLTIVGASKVKLNNGKKYWYWKAVCDCGNNVTVRPADLVKGKMKSCGCYVNELKRKPKKHGESGTKLHNIWCGMKTRCNTDNKKYGRRGIRVCDEWRKYEAFAEWAKNNGYEDGLSIERIDVNGNYCPKNCTWIPLKQQARNKRTTHWVTYNGKKMSLVELCEKTGMPYKLIHERVTHYKWPIEKALSTPLWGATIQKETTHTCLVCGKIFTSHSYHSMYCSKECYRIVANARRREMNETKKVF